MDRTWYQQLQVLEDETKPLEMRERLQAMNGPLLHWYEHHARVLPWREDPKPYRVWISEIMLQQTRVEAVKPYFERFMQELPTIQALAEVAEDRLLKLWEGLGYYNRARNLQKAAQILMKDYRGEMPSEYEELLKLPGIGSYTAGAIASIAFGTPVPAVDGNVLRVISRVLASRRDILKQATKTWMETELVQTMPADAASHFNQGLIEIGAVVCIPNGEPKCPNCPLASICLARKKDLIAEIPVKTKAKKRRIEKKTVLVVEYEDRIGLRKRPDQGLLASLYELPNVEGHLLPEELAEALALAPDMIANVKELPAAKHVFSHVEWHMIGYYVWLKKNIPDGYLAIEKEQIFADYALPNAFHAYTKQIK